MGDFYLSNDDSLEKFQHFDQELYEVHTVLFHTINFEQI